MLCVLSAVDFLQLCLISFTVVCISVVGLEESPCPQGLLVLVLGPEVLVLVLGPKSPRKLLRTLHSASSLLCMIT